MFISNVAIRRPVFTAMVILAMIVFGIVSLMGLGVDLFPKVDFPIVSIITTLPGADPETMEKRVTDIIEEAVNTLSGIKTLRSTSAEGYSLVLRRVPARKEHRRGLPGGAGAGQLRSGRSCPRTSRIRSSRNSTWTPRRS